MKAVLLLALAACGGDASTSPPSDAAGVDAGDRAAIVPGERVGSLRLGMRWAEVLAALGPPPSQPLVLVRLGHVAWPELGLEALLTSANETELSPDAVVIGAGATAAMAFVGPARPGDARAAVEAALGPPPESFGGRAFYPAGLAVEYDDADVVRRVGVIAPYRLRPSPPPMRPAAGSSP